MSAFLRSMAGRVFALLLAGVAASATLTFVLAVNERQHALERQRTVRSAALVEQLTLSLEGVPPEARAELLLSAQDAGISPAAAEPADSAWDPDSPLAAELEDRLGAQRQVRATHPSRDGCPRRRRFPGVPEAGAPDPAALCRIVSLSLDDGTPLLLAVASPREPVPEATPMLPIFALVFAACILALAYAIARMATRPLSELASAAVRLGRNIESPPLPESGPAEVRDAAVAFNAMQARIRRDVQERTYMLAAITHDLQTPLTRLRLRLEKVDSAELRDKLVADLSAMQGTIREGLELARSADLREPLIPIDFDSLLDSACADAQDAGQDVTLHGKTGAAVLGAPNALRRCLMNLLDNAVKYGGFARVEATLEGARAIVRIRDGGPGIPEDRLGAVLDPFFRLESSRSRETGGTGLGLTIARNIAERHGGTLALRNLPEGGLEATLAIPRSNGQAV
jgi:signal transduction histidine kinase